MRKFLIPILFLTLSTAVMAWEDDKPFKFDKDINYHICYAANNRNVGYVVAKITDIVQVGNKSMLVLGSKYRVFIPRKEDTGYISLDAVVAIMPSSQITDSVDFCSTGRSARRTNKGQYMWQKSPDGVTREIKYVE